MKKLLLGLCCLLQFNASALDLNSSTRFSADKTQDAARKPAQIIEFAEVKPNDKVLDLLAGGGYYSELLSQAVGEQGEVTLQIPQAYLQFAGKQLEQRLANNRLTNVTKLLSEADNLQLKANYYDSVFLVLGYHDMFFEEQGWSFTAKQVMPQVAKALKSGGKLLIVDHNTAQNMGVSQVKSLHRIEQQFVINDVPQYGFKLVKQSELLANDKDDHSKIVFDKSIRRKTDRFVLLFEKQ